MEAVVINDDVAVQDSLYTAGRRGVGTTVLAEKICGAAAEAHRPLKEVAELCRRVNANGRSMGMALTSCTVPAAGKPTFDLGEQEMEIGIGIHGEPGRERRALASADEIVEMLTKPIVEDLPFKRGDSVLAFVNSMGGTPLIELYIVYRALARYLDGVGVKIERRLIGPYITSLEMAGLFHNPAPSRRRDDPAVGRPRQHPRAALGSSEQQKRSVRGQRRWPSRMSGDLPSCKASPLP